MTIDGDARAMRTLLRLDEDAPAQDVIDALMGVVSEASLWRAMVARGEIPPVNSTAGMVALACADPEADCPAWLRPGSRVCKPSGDYRFNGEIAAVFLKRSGARRVVVENDDGILHIFNEKQLKPEIP